MKTVGFLFWILVLWRAAAVHSQQTNNNNNGNNYGNHHGNMGGSRRQRQVMQFFPGCMQEALQNGTTATTDDDSGVVNVESLVTCMEARADDRCWTDATTTQVETCFLDLQQQLQQQRPQQGGGGMMQGDNNDNMGGGNGNGSSQGGNINSKQGGANGNANMGGGNSNGGNNMGGEGGGGGMNQQGGNNGNMMGGGNNNNNNNMMGGGNGNNGQGEGGNMMMGGGGGGQSRWMGMVGNCTADYLSCARENLQQDLQNLPSCVNDTLRSLAACVMTDYENGTGAISSSCLESCRRFNQSGQANQFRIPKDLLQQQNRLQNCMGIRKNIMRPMCRRMSCCSPCMPVLEEFGDCFFNNMINYLSEPCTGECPAAEEGDGTTTPENRRRSLSLLGPTTISSRIGRPYDQPRNFTRFLQEADYESLIYNECIELAPGINEAQRSEDELAARGADFFDCVVDQVYQVMELSAVTGNGVDTMGGADATSGRLFSWKDWVAWLLPSTVVLAWGLV